MTTTDRFAFGENWNAFLQTVDQHRITEAVDSLKEKLQVDSLAGKTFLDLGCGSGLFSLAAQRLGANVTSVDFDPQCVACTETLKARHGDSSSDWFARQGSALDEAFLESLGSFDVVYSWGVLHHTGNMNFAIELASLRVCQQGTFFIAIYNDQGGSSRRWLAIKMFYHRLPPPLRPLWVGTVALYYECKFALARLLSLKNPLPFSDWKSKKHDRGMSVWHDWVDWVGGLPFEVARPEEIIVPLRRRHFVLENLKTVGKGWGCNEYVFTRQDDVPSATADRQ